MTVGVLGRVMSTANTNVNVYTVPTTISYTTLSISICNQGSTDATTKVAITSSSSPSAADYIEFGATIPANGGVLERTCILVTTGESVIINCSNSSCSIRVHGYEESAITTNA